MQKEGGKLCTCVHVFEQEREKKHTCSKPDANTSLEDVGNVFFLK